MERADLTKPPAKDMLGWWLFRTKAGLIKQVVIGMAITKLFTISAVQQNTCFFPVSALSKLPLQK